GLRRTVDLEEHGDEGVQVRELLVDREAREPVHVVRDRLEDEALPALVEEDPVVLEVTEDELDQVEALLLDERLGDLPVLVEDVVSRAQVLGGKGRTKGRVEELERE